MRNPSLDILKAIAILLVIVGHNSTGVLNNYIYSFHMPLFFILAGYLWKERPVWQSITHDFKRIMIPYFGYFVVYAIIGCICFGISAFLSKSGIGIGIGIASMMYFLNIVANISKDAKVLKYFTPFGYTEGSDIINDKALKIEYLIPSMIIMVIGIVIAYVKYNKKDIKA